MELRLTVSAFLLAYHGMVLAAPPSVSEMLAHQPAVTSQQIVVVKPKFEQMKEAIISGRLGQYNSRNASDLPTVDSRNNAIQNLDKYFYYPCVVNCGDHKDRDSLWIGLTSIYWILKEHYQLSGSVYCRNYSSVDWRLLAGRRATPYSDVVFEDFGNYLPAQRYKLGELDQRIMSVSNALADDVYEDMKAMADLAHPNTFNKEKIIENFKNRHRFIKKSCGDKFMVSYDAFLDDVGKIWASKTVESKGHGGAVIATANRDLDSIKKAAIESFIASKNQRISEIDQIVLREESIDSSNAQAEKCLRSTDKKIADLSQLIVYSVNTIKSANERIRQDEQASKISGYRNVGLRHMMANTIVAQRSNVSRHFAEYKSLGGSAPTPDLVRISNLRCPPVTNTSKDQTWIRGLVEEKRLLSLKPNQRLDFENEVSKLRQRIGSTYHRVYNESPYIAGRLVVRAIVAADGRVLGAAIIEKEFSAPELEEKIVMLVKSTRFESGNFEVFDGTYVFNFSAMD